MTIIVHLLVETFGVVGLLIDHDVSMSLQTGNFWSYGHCAGQGYDHMLYTRSSCESHSAIHNRYHEIGCCTRSDQVWRCVPTVVTFYV